MEGGVKGGHHPEKAVRGTKRPPDESCMNWMSTGSEDPEGHRVVLVSSDFRAYQAMSDASLNN